MSEISLSLASSVVHLRLHLGAVVLGLDRGGRRALVEQLVLDLDPEIGQRRLGRVHPQLRILELLLELRVAQLEGSRCRGPPSCRV